METASSTFGAVTFAYAYSSWIDVLSRDMVPIAKSPKQHNTYIKRGRTRKRGLVEGDTHFLAVGEASW